MEEREMIEAYGMLMKLILAYMPIVVGVNACGVDISPPFDMTLNVNHNLIHVDGTTCIRVHDVVVPDVTVTVQCNGYTIENMDVDKNPVGFLLKVENVVNGSKVNYVNCGFKSDNWTTGNEWFGVQAVNGRAYGSFNQFWNVGEWMSASQLGDVGGGSYGSYFHNANTYMVKLFAPSVVGNWYGDFNLAGNNRIGAPIVVDNGYNAIVQGNKVVGLDLGQGQGVNRYPMDDALNLFGDDTGVNPMFGSVITGNNFSQFGEACAEFSGSHKTVSYTKNVCTNANIGLGGFYYFSVDGMDVEGNVMSGVNDPFAFRSIYSTYQTFFTNVVLKDNKDLSKSANNSFFGIAGDMKGFDLFNVRIGGSDLGSVLYFDMNANTGNVGDDGGNTCNMTSPLGLLGCN
jgi:hypothetical protein